MTAVIGVTPGNRMLALWTGRDFKWTFENLDENDNVSDFPPGDLLFDIDHSTDNGATSTTKWFFVISGGKATINVDSTQADLIPGGTKWQLVFLPSGETTGGNPIANGTVNRVG